MEFMHSAKGHSHLTYQQRVQRPRSGCQDHLCITNGTTPVEGRREKGEGRREKGEGRREKGEGRREKGEGRREKGERRGRKKKGEKKYDHLLRGYIKLAQPDNPTTQLLVVFKLDNDLNHKF